MVFGGSPLPANFGLKGRYTIQRYLGGGKMGGVYRAYDLLAGLNVAIKQSFMSSDSELHTQFIREAQLLYRLEHRGLPKVFDYFVEQKDQYMVMSFIPGPTLRERIKSSSSHLAINQV